MKKSIFTFGLISGVIASLMMVATVPFMEHIGSDYGYVLGYTTIILPLLLVFFGVRSYRDNVAKGQITFGKAFLVGLAITVISCLFYVATWEIIYFNFMPDFMDKYGAHVIQQMQASGATAAAAKAVFAVFRTSSGSSSVRYRPLRSLNCAVSSPTASRLQKRSPSSAAEPRIAMGIVAMGRR